MVKLIVAFRNSADSPKIELSLPCLNVTSLRHINGGRKDLILALNQLNAQNILL